MPETVKPIKVDSCQKCPFAHVSASHDWGGLEYSWMCWLDGPEGAVAAQSPRPTDDGWPPDQAPPANCPLRTFSPRFQV